MTGWEFVIVAILGGVLAVDTVSVAQVMISRPIVAATLSGLLFGAPELGLIVGAVLEMLAVETMPFGASRYLEWTSASVVAAAVVSHYGSFSATVLLVAVLAAIAVAWLGGVTMVQLRRFNGYLAGRSRRQLEGGDISRVFLLQGVGILLDFLRGAALATGAVALLIPVARSFTDMAASSGSVGVIVVLALPGAVALAACWRMFASATRRRFLMVGGALVGMALLFAQ